MKSAATSRRNTLRLGVLGAALLGLAWCVVLASRPPAPNSQQASALEAERGDVPPPPGELEGAAVAQRGPEQPQGAAEDRLQKAHAQLRVYLAKPAAPLSRPLRVALLRGRKIIETSLVSEDRPGVFSKEPQAPLVLVLEEVTLPDWAVGPLSHANVGPGLPGWTAVQRVEWSHQEGLDIELSLEQAGELLVMVWGPDGDPVAQVPVQMSAPAPGGRARPTRTRTDDDGALHLKHARPGIYEFSPIFAPGGEAISAPVKTELFAGKRSTLDIVLEETRGSLSGTVLDQGNNPVARASLSVSWQGRAIRSAETDSEGRFKVEGLPHAPVTLSLRQRTASALSVLYPKEIEQGFNPITATPTQDLGELRVTSGTTQTAKAALVGTQPEDTGELRVFITFPFEANPTWNDLLKRQHRELQVSGEGAIEYLAPRTNQKVQITVWEGERLIGTAITTHKNSSTTQIHTQP